MKIGVLALQGDFREHLHMLKSLGVDAVEVRLPEHLDSLDGLIIPGGESTTIGKLAVTYGLISPLQTFARQRPVWGTCAGMIFLAKDIGMEQPVLGVMDITVNRNAFGRQRESFEAHLDINVLNSAFHAIFIRAPMVTAIHDNAEDVEILACLEDGGIVAVQQRHLLATAFHPELTGDSRLHAHFIEVVRTHS